MCDVAPEFGAMTLAGGQIAGVKLEMGSAP